MSQNTLNQWPRLARALYWLAAATALTLAVVAAIASGAEPELARSAAIMWLVALPMFGLFAALLIGALR